MKEKERKGALVFLLLILSLLLIGCTPNPIIIERNNTINRTIYVNNTIYINDTIPCNQTSPEINITYDRLELIRRLKYLEGQQDKRIINETECMPHNATEENLKECWGDRDRYMDDIYELDDELDECETRLCDINSTWC